MKNINFKSFSIVIIIILSLFSSSAFAGASYKYKKKCKKRYRAEAHIWSLLPFPICKSIKKSCGGIYQWNPAFCSKNCAWATAWYNPSSSYANWNVTCPAVWAGEPNILDEKIGFNAMTETSNTRGDRSISSGEASTESLSIDENNRIIIFNSLSATLKIKKGEKQFSDLKLRGINEVDDERNNERILKEEVFWELKIEVRDGEIVGIDKLDEEYYTVLENDDFLILEICDYTIKSKIPKSVDISNVVLEVATDGGEIKEDRYKDTAKKSLEIINETDIKFDVFPIPTVDFISISVELPNTKNISINIFDASGTLMRRITQNENTKSIEIRDIDLCDFHKGLYFISLEGASEKVLIKKILVN